MCNRVFKQLNLIFWTEDLLILVCFDEFDVFMSVYIVKCLETQGFDFVSGHLNLDFDARVTIVKISA